jgi:hypothetical protein
MTDGEGIFTGTLGNGKVPPIPAIHPTAVERRGSIRMSS